MELGNLLFGTGVGQPYQVDREKFGGLFFNLLNKYVFANDMGSIDTIVTDVFELRPYYWGDCNCDYDIASIEWEKQNKHNETCYQTELLHLKQKFDNKFDHDQKESKELRQKFKLPYQGCEVHCTCDYKSNWYKFLKIRGCTHTKDCEVAKPNFWYKPTNLIIEWYKYPLRSSYSNRTFTESELKEIFNECWISYVKWAKENQNGYLHQHKFDEYDDNPNQVGTTIVNCWHYCKFH